MSRKADRKQPTVTMRCAIYTRKSTEEGLDQEFNSLDAQREAGEAFITSQQQEGCGCLPNCYDDGGFPGGNSHCDLYHERCAGRGATRRRALPRVTRESWRGRDCPPNNPKRRAAGWRESACKPPCAYEADCRTTQSAPEFAPQLRVALSPITLASVGIAVPPTGRVEIVG
jgi:hypothetical protein